MQNNAKYPYPFKYKAGDLIVSKEAVEGRPYSYLLVTHRSFYTNEAKEDIAVYKTELYTSNNSPYYKLELNAKMVDRDYRKLTPTEIVLYC